MRQEIELSNRRRSMAEAMNKYDYDTWETVNMDTFYMSLGNVIVKRYNNVLL